MSDRWFYTWNELDIDISDKDEEKIDRMLTELKQIAPNIYWNIQYTEYESLDSFLAYPTLEVPEEQWDEAQEIIELWEEDFDFSEYDPIDYRYPGVYINVGETKELTPEVKEFEKCTSELYLVIKNADTTDISITLNNIFIVLSKIITIAIQLPRYELDLNVSFSSNQPSDDFIFYSGNDIEGFMKSHYITEELKDILDKISSNLNEIDWELDVHNKGDWIEYEKRDGKLVSVLTTKGYGEAVYYWSSNIFWESEYSLGHTITQTLELTRVAQSILNKKILRNGL